MKHFLLISCLTLFGFLANLGQANATIEGEQQIYAQLLTHENSTHIKVAAQSIYNKSIQNIELIDLAAEVLARNIAGELALDEDDAAWVAKAIGTSQSQRYTALLQSVLEADISRKIKKHTKTALKKLTAPADSVFVKGSIDLTAIGKKIDQKQSNSASVSKQAFNTVRVGDRIDEVLEKLGSPSAIDVIFGRRRQSWVGTVTYSMLRLSFGEQGGFNLQYVNNQANWIVKNTLATYNQPTTVAGLNRHPIMSEKAPVVRAHVINLVKRANSTELERDMAAERLYTNLNDDDYLDTLSWICRLLGLSGTDRYRATLEYVIANADARKLRKYAQKALKRTTTGSGVQYQAGDVLKL